MVSWILGFWWFLGFVRCGLWGMGQLLGLGWLDEVCRG